MKSIDTKSVKDFLFNNLMIIFMIAASIVVGMQRANFFSLANMGNLISNTSVRFIVALGVSGCLISRGTDLSAGRSVGLAACIAATLLQRDGYSQKVYPELGEPSMIIVLLVVVAVTMFFGFCNGLVVSFLHVPPFIATLGMQTIVYGICLVFTGAQPIGGLRRDYTQMASGVFGSFPFSRALPYLGFFALGLGIVMWFMYNRTAHGKYIYAIGGNEHAAEVSGINTKLTKIVIYTTAGLLYGIAGFLIGGRAGGSSVNIGFGWELEAIAGCTIGGVSTSGGVGRVSGILLGVLVFELLKIAMQFMGVEPSYTYIVQGIVIITAVSLDIRKYIAQK